MFLQRFTQNFDYAFCAFSPRIVKFWKQKILVLSSIAGSCYLKKKSPFTWKSCILEVSNLPKIRFLCFFQQKKRIFKERIICQKIFCIKFPTKVVPWLFLVKCIRMCLMQLAEVDTLRVNENCVSRVLFFLLLCTTLALFFKKYWLYKYPNRQFELLDRQSKQ